MLESASASSAADGHAGGAAAAKMKGGRDGDSTPTRRRISRSIQAQAAAAASSSGSASVAAEAGGIGGQGSGGRGGDMAGDGGGHQYLRALQMELVDSLQQGHVEQELFMEMLEDFAAPAAAWMDAEAAAASAASVPSEYQPQPQQQPLSQQVEWPTSFVIPNEKLEPGAAVVETTRERLLRLETEFERGTVEEALEEYKAVQETLFRTGKAANLPVVKRQVFAWCVSC